jgi:hypothetical protein
MTDADKVTFGLSLTQAEARPETLAAFNTSARGVGDRQWD